MRSPSSWLQGSHRLLSFCLLLVLSSVNDQASDTQAPESKSQVAEIGNGRILTLMKLLSDQLKAKQQGAARQTVQELRPLLRPDDPRYFQMASLCAMRGEYQLAIPLMETLRDALPQSYDVKYNLALAYLRNKEGGKAAAVLELLIGQAPRAEAYNLLAVAKEDQKHYLDAVRAFQKAAELEPTSEDYRYDYAFELLKHKTERAAIAVFVSGVRDFPRSVKMRLGLGCSYQVIGKNEDAARVLLELIKIEPRNALSYTFLGRTYEQAQPLQSDIIMAFRNYLSQQPRDAWAFYHYGRILYLRGVSSPTPDFKEATAYLRQAVKLKHDFAEALVQLAMVSQAEDQVQESISLLRQAVQSKPTLAAAHYRLGIAYKRLGQEREAATEFSLSEKLNAEDETRRQKQEVIQFLVEQGT